MKKFFLFFIIGLTSHQLIISQDVASEEKSEICAICRHSLKEGTLADPFTCKHEFHINCIQRWLEQAVTCPLCKSQLSDVTNSKINNEFVWAAAEGKINEVIEMLQNGTDVNSISTSGETALMLTSIGGSGNPEIIRILLSAGADINKSPEILGLSARHASPETLRLLIDTGIDINKVNNLGVTPLMEAATYGNAEGVRLLLENGADKNLKDIYQKRTALDWANWAKNRHENIHRDYTGVISLLS